MEKSFIFLKCQVCLVYPKWNEVHEVMNVHKFAQERSRTVHHHFAWDNTTVVKEDCTVLTTYTDTRGEDEVQQGTSMCTATWECWNKWPNILTVQHPELLYIHCHESVVSNIVTSISTNVLQLVTAIFYGWKLTIFLSCDVALNFNPWRYKDKFVVPSSKLKCVSPPCLSSPLRIERSPSPTKVEEEEKIKSSRDQVKQIQEATKYWVTF